MVGLWSLETRKKPAQLLGALLLWCLCIPAFGSAYVQPAEEQRPCPAGDYPNENGTCCNKCNAGSKFVAPCVAAGQRTTCVECPEGQYTEQMNFTPNCRGCTSCRGDHEEVFSKCTKKKNTVCRCKKGFYKDVINSDTSQCLPCSTCLPNQRQLAECTPERNTVCECEKGFYKMKKQCLPCTKCTDFCNGHCASSPVNSPTKDRDVSVVVGVCGLVLLGAVGIITYMATKHRTKSKMMKGAATPTEAVSEETTKVLIHREEFSYEENKMALPCILVCEQELSKLPDCIPLEINIPGLIYAVLNLVPASRVKELVRGLGVTDVEIERAVMDHHSCKEAHYQMLRAWVERESRDGGVGRGGGVMHQPLMQQLLDRLRDMHLGGAVEELETKYGIVGGQVGAA